MKGYPFFYFKDGGYIFFDVIEVASSNYAKKGSTDITLKKDSIATFTDVKNTISETNTNLESEITSPHTGIYYYITDDNDLSYIFLLILSIIGLYCTTIYPRESN